MHAACRVNITLSILPCLIRMNGQAGRVSEALDLFGEMVERGETPNKIAVNHVLAACARDAPNFSRHAKAIFEVEK